MNIKMMFFGGEGFQRDNGWLVRIRFRIVKKIIFNWVILTKASIQVGCLKTVLCRRLVGRWEFIFGKIRWDVENIRIRSWLRNWSQEKDDIKVGNWKITEGDSVLEDGIVHCWEGGFEGMGSAVFHEEEVRVGWVVWLVRKFKLKID